MAEKGNIPKDPSKRGRLLFIAFAIMASMFLMRVFDFWPAETPFALLLKGGAYFAVSYLALIWAFRFEVNKLSLMIVLPQSAFFVASNVLFIELFFFRRFERVIDFVALSIVGIGMFLALYVSFLMTNVFNVSLFRELPLKQVAKTTSYILTLLMVYLFSFSFLALQWHLIYTVIMLVVLYGSVLWSHYYHLNFSRRNLFSAIVVVLTAMLASVASTMFVGSKHEIIALMPTAIAFSMIGITMHKQRGEDISNTVLLEYYGVFAFAVALNLLLG